MFGKKKEKKDLTNLSIYTAFHHISGLPIVEDTLCEVYSFPDRLDFKAGTTEITMSIKTDTEIQNQAVSSVGGAVAGAMLFGAIGAVIGGRAKNKKVKTVTKYLIITYLGDTEPKFIIFDIKNNPQSADKLVKEFQKTDSSSGVKIEL